MTKIITAGTPNYKVNSLVAAYVLRFDIIEAYVMWMLAQRYDRYKYRKTNSASGTIMRAEEFVYWSADQMKCDIRTARNRFKIATDHHFLRFFPDENKITINSGWNLYKRANRKLMRGDAKILCSDPEIDNFTRLFFDWVDPTDLTKTKQMLFSAVAEQGNYTGRSVSILASLLKKSVSTIERWKRHPGLVQQPQYVLFDIASSIIKPESDARSCNQAFANYEAEYRRANRMPGKKFFQCRTIDLLNHTDLYDYFNDQTTFYSHRYQTVVALQAANFNKSTLNINVTPTAFRIGLRKRGIAALTSQLRDRPASEEGYGRDSEGSDFAASYNRLCSSESKKAKSSGGVCRDQFPRRVIKKYASFVKGMLSTQECSDYMQMHTGCSPLSKRPFTVEPIAFRGHL